MLDNRDPRDDPVTVLEGWLAMLGRLGRAGHVAVPRLNAWRNHPNPWVRMWVRETLEKIESRTAVRDPAGASPSQINK